MEQAELVARAQKGDREAFDVLITGTPSPASSSAILTSPRTRHRRLSSAAGASCRGSGMRTSSMRGCGDCSSTP
jgi:hypothetical protein